jgi:hypothetical protein
MTQPTKWEKVSGMISRYHLKMKNISNLLVAEPIGFEMKKDKERLDFFIDQEALKRIDKIRALPEFDRLALFFGTDEDKDDSNTIIIFGADKNGKVLKENKANNPEAEETWPDGNFNLRTVPDDLEDYLK